MYYVKVGDKRRISFGTSDPASGAAVNADSLPVITILEDGVVMGYSPSVINQATGLYEVEIICSGANGFELGKEYAAYVTVVVGAITGRESIDKFAITSNSIEVKLDDVRRLTVATSNPATGAAVNADSTPTVTVLEDGVAMGYSPAVAAVATGLYEVTIACSAANGFEVGKSYSVYVTATVGGVTGRDGIDMFNISATGIDDITNPLTVSFVQVDYAVNESVPAKRILPMFVVDAITGEPTNVAINNTHVQLFKHGGSWTNATNNPVAVAGQDGAWELELTQAELSTAGPLKWRVVHPNIRFVMDWVMVGTIGGLTNINVVQWAGVNVSNANSYPAVNISASSTDVVNANALAADAVAEIQSGLATAANLSTVSSNVNAISSSITALSSSVSGIPGLVWEELAADHTTPGTYGELLQSPVGQVVFDAANSTTQFKTDLTETQTNYYKDAWCCFLDGPLKEQVHKVTGYNGSTKFITVTVPYSGAPAAGNRFVLVTK